MNPVFFGDNTALLYGIHHPPKVEGRDAGVVLCSPFGQEYMRAHRAMRQLALLLTRKGYHVLRFDYLGTGDSSGELHEVSADQWVANVGQAIDELRELTGVSAVSVVGLRLGALLASQACAGREDIERLVLWDPISSGESYEAELQREIAAEGPREYSAHSGNAIDADGTMHYNGYSMSARFREALRKLELAPARPAPTTRVLQVVSHETEGFAALQKAWRDLPGFRFQHTPAPHDWNYVDNFGGILLPQPVIQAIVNWMD